MSRPSVLRSSNETLAPSGPARPQDKRQAPPPPPLHPSTGATICALAATRGLGSIEVDGDPDMIRDLLKQIGRDWTVPSIMLIAGKSRRFNALSRSMPGISKKMLAQTLRSLERDGLVERRVFDTRPPRTEYWLSQLGHSLVDPLAALLAWARANQARVRHAQRDYDSRAE